MRWGLVFLLVSVILSQVLAEDSTEDSPAPKRVLKKYRVRRPVVVDDQGNVVRAGPPRLRRIRVKQPRPTETAALQGTPAQQVVASPSPSTQPIVLSTNPPRVRPTVAVAPATAAAPLAQPTQPTRTLQVQQPKIRKPEPVFLEDAPQVIEQVRTVPTYRQATPSANRQALLANVNYKSRGVSSAQSLDDEEEDDQKVGTVRNYSHINEDGSFTFGYEAADGSFKEETRGIDCVVRGKYGYVDPDGVRREFEYVSGNPCDPNAPKEDELPEEDDEDERAAPPPRPLLRRVRPEINENNLQGLQQVREEALTDDQLNQYVRPVPRQRVIRPIINAASPSPRPRIRITTVPPTLPSQTEGPALVIRERPATIRPFVYQEPSQSLDSDRGGRGFNFDAEIQRLARPISQPQPLYEQPLQVVQRHPTPTVASQPTRQYFGGAAAFRQFLPEAAPTAASAPAKPVAAAAPAVSSTPERNPAFGRYRTELVYDPSTGQYTSVTVQAMPHSTQEIELTQKLRAFVEPQRPNQLNIQSFGQPQIQYFGVQQQPTTQQQPQTQAAPASPNGQIDQFLARNAYSQQRLIAQQQQVPQAQPQPVQNLQYFPQHQAQPQLRQNPSPTAPAPVLQQAPQQSPRQFQFPSAPQSLDDSRNPANGQIDAFLRALNIDI